MTVDELKNIFNTAVVVLQDNKAIATPEVIAGIEKIVADLGGPAPAVSFDSVFQEILKGVHEVCEIEKRFVQTTMTDNLVRILTNIQNHPIIMHLIARII